RPTPPAALPECNGTGRCAMLRAPRPVPLLRRAIKAQINPELYSSLDERWGSGQIKLKRIKKWRVRFNSPLTLVRWNFSKPFIVIRTSLFNEECEPLRQRSLTNILAWL